MERNFVRQHLTCWLKYQKYEDREDGSVSEVLLPRVWGPECEPWHPSKNRVRWWVTQYSSWETWQGRSFRAVNLLTLLTRYIHNALVDYVIPMCKWAALIRVVVSFSNSPPALGTYEWLRKQIKAQQSSAANSLLVQDGTSVAPTFIPYSFNWVDVLPVMCG